MEEIKPNELVKAINWTEIQLPRLEDIPLDLLRGGTVKVTQKVLLSNEAPGSVARHPEVVEFDRYFLKYQIASSIAPLLVKYLQENLTEYKENREQLTSDILELLSATIIEATDSFVEHRQRAEEICVSVKLTPTAFMRSFKQYLKDLNRTRRT